jgi:hypothetical protein
MMCGILLVSKLSVEPTYDISSRHVIWTVLSLWIPWQYLQSSTVKYWSCNSIHTVWQESVLKKATQYSYIPTPLSFFCQSRTNTCSHIMADSSYSNFHATFSDLRYKTNVSMSPTLWETDVVLDASSGKKRIPGSKPIKDKTQSII